MANKQAPDWLTPQHFTKIIINKHENVLKIKKLIITAALANLENSITKLLKVTVKFKLKDHSKCNKEHFILKIPCTSEYRLLFLYEKDMYNHIVQELEDIYLKENLKAVKFKAKTFQLPAGIENETDYILMEDLTEQNFKKSPNSKGLNEVETRLVLHKLAQWHATSMKRVESVDIYNEAYRNSCFIEDEKQLLQNMHEMFKKPFLKMLLTTNLEKDLLKKLLKYMQNLTTLQLSAAKINPYQVNVLNHGDLWLGNLMFQYSDDMENVLDVIFIDFQMPKYGNPAQDLFSLLISSTAWEFKINKFEEFIKFYHGSLILHLRLLNYRNCLPSLDDLHESLRAGGVWSFIAAQRLLPIVLMDPYENSNIEAFINPNLEGQAVRTRLLSNPHNALQIEEILRWLIDKEYLKFN